jgi:hypothetical protein
MNVINCMGLHVPQWQATVMTQTGPIMSKTKDPTGALWCLWYRSGALGCEASLCVGALVHRPVLCCVVLCCAVPFGATLHLPE